MTESSSDVTLEVYSLTSDAHSTDCSASNTSEHVSSAASLVVAEKKQNKAKQETVNATPPVRNTSDVEDEDQLFTQLLVSKTGNNLVQDESFKMPTAINQKTIVPDITDEENDNLLEELLAQPI